MKKLEIFLDDSDKNYGKLLAAILADLKRYSGQEGRHKYILSEQSAQNDEKNAKSSNVNQKSSDNDLENDPFSPKKQLIRRKFKELFGYMNMRKSYYLEQTALIMKNYDPDIIIYACNQCMRNNKASIGYLEAVLANKTGKRLPKDELTTKEEKQKKYTAAAAYLSRIYPYIDTKNPPPDLNFIFENDLGIMDAKDKNAIIKLINKT